MLFDPTVFKVLWIGTACLALVVGLTLAALAVAHVLAVIQVIRKTKLKQLPEALTAFLRQGRHNPRSGHLETQQLADWTPVAEPPSNFPF